MLPPPPDKYFSLGSLTRIDDNYFFIDSILSRGHSSTVYKAKIVIRIGDKYHYTDSFVAIKVFEANIRPGNAFSTDGRTYLQSATSLPPISSKTLSPHTARQRFIREMDIYSELPKDTAPRFLKRAFCNDPGRTPFFITEYNTSGTLGDYLDHYGPLSHQDTIDAMKSICRAVSVLHRFGTYHLDIKPTNIVGSPCLECLLIDFGSAILASDLPFARNNASLTPAFAAPETASTDYTITDPVPLDIYSLGATALALYTGGTPSPWLIQTISDSCPLKSIISKAMAHNPADRYKSAEEMLLDLTQPTVDLSQKNMIDSIELSSVNLDEKGSDYIVTLHKGGSAHVQYNTDGYTIIRETTSKIIGIPDSVYQLLTAGFVNTQLRILESNDPPESDAERHKLVRSSITIKGSPEFSLDCDRWEPKDDAPLAQIIRRLISESCLKELFKISLTRLEINRIPQHIRIIYKPAFSQRFNRSWKSALVTHTSAGNKEIRDGQFLRFVRMINRMDIQIAPRKTFNSRSYSEEPGALTILIHYPDGKEDKFELNAFNTDRCGGNIVCRNISVLAQELFNAVDLLEGDRPIDNIDRSAVDIFLTLRGEFHKFSIEENIVLSDNKSSCMIPKEKADVAIKKIYQFILDNLKKTATSQQTRPAGKPLAEVVFKSFGNRVPADIPQGWYYLHDGQINTNLKCDSDTFTSHMLNIINDLIHQRRNTQSSQSDYPKLP